MLVIIKKKKTPWNSVCNAYLYTRGAGKKKVEKTIKNNLNSPFLTPMTPIGFH